MPLSQRQGENYTGLLFTRDVLTGSSDDEIINCRASYHLLAARPVTGTVLLILPLAQEKPETVGLINLVRPF